MSKERKGSATIKRDEEISTYTTPGDDKELSIEAGNFDRRHSWRVNRIWSWFTVGASDTVMQC